MYTIRVCNRWVDTTYKGKTYLPLSTKPDQVVTKVGEKDEAKFLLKGTWSTSSVPSEPPYSTGYGYPLSSNTVGGGGAYDTGYGSGYRGVSPMRGALTSSVYLRNNHPTTSSSQYSHPYDNTAGIPIYSSSSSSYRPLHPPPYPTGIDGPSSPLRSLNNMKGGWNTDGIDSLLDYKSPFSATMETRK